MPEFTLIIPTRNRPDELARTLEAIGALDAAPIFHAGGAEVIVADNASDPPADVPTRLPNGLVVHTLREETNRGTAIRNAAAARARGNWLLMLDDDSAPTSTGFVQAAACAADDVAAIGAEIRLPDGSRERGGLPEVIIGCGALVRTDRFLEAGGYDEAFGYYAEEYDLCARLLLAGHRVTFDKRFTVQHRKVTTGRDMDEILRRITRNSAWVELRYAPDELRDAAVEHVVERYARIAQKENAERGYDRGVAELAADFDQARAPLSLDLYDRFMGLAHARSALASARTLIDGKRVALVHAGKQSWAVERALAELALTGAGCELIADPSAAETLVVGTLSPGPMLDALERSKAQHPTKRIIAPWIPGMPPVRIAPVVRSFVAA